MINDLLFVYGSLLDATNEFANYLISNSVLYSAGKLQGKLYDVGEYPGAVINTEGSQYVFGSIYRLTNPEKAFIVLDDYEGFGAEQLQPNLFVRELIAIETEMDIMKCWVYLYNLPIIGVDEIAPGNYADYLKQKKR